MAGIRKIFKMQKGRQGATMHAVIKDSFDTGDRPLNKTIGIDVCSEIGDYSEELTFPYDVTLLGGGFAVGEVHNGDKISMIIAPDTPYEAKPVDEVEMQGFAGCAYWREIGDLKIGGSFVPMGITVRFTYHNLTGGDARRFVPAMEFAY